MNITGVKSGVSHYHSRQFSKRKMEGGKDGPEEAVDRPSALKSAKPVDVTAKSVSINRSANYDLENITLKETYRLAVDLLESETIGLHDYIKLSAIGLN